MSEVSGAIPSSVGNMTALTYVHGVFEPVLPSTIGPKHPLPTAVTADRRLVMSNNLLSGTLPSTLGGLSQLS